MSKYILNGACMTLAVIGSVACFKAGQTSGGWWAIIALIWMINCTLVENTLDNYRGK